MTGLAAALVAYDDANQRSNASRLGHIGAYEGMLAAVQDVVQSVRILDGFNRNRYRDDPKSLGVWKAASNIFGPVERAGDAIADTLETPIPENPSRLPAVPTSRPTEATA